VYGRPASTFVASFIGSPPMNLLPGTVGAHRRSFEIAGAEAGRSIALSQSVTALAGRSALLGIRPEHLVPSNAGLTIGVEMVEALGADMLIHGKAGDASVVARLPDAGHPQYGETMTFGFSGDRVHWFDPADGKRIAAA
jgi:sn-glycerol 3-phosphate transport system ATP-binding protein